MQREAEESVQTKVKRVTRRESLTRRVVAVVVWLYGSLL